MRDCVVSSLRGGRISHCLMWRHRQQNRNAHGSTGDVPNAENVKVSSARWRLSSAGDQKPVELLAQNSSQPQLSSVFFLHNTTTVRDSASSRWELTPSAGPPPWSRRRCGASRLASQRRAPQTGDILAETDAFQQDAPLELTCDQRQCGLTLSRGLKGTVHTFY